MEDFANILHRDYGLKPGGKSAPMAGSHSRAGSSGGPTSASRMGNNDDVFSSAFSSMSVNDRNSGSGAVYDDVFGGPPTGVRRSSSNDDVFGAPRTGVRSSSNDDFGDLLGGFGSSRSRPQASQNSFGDDLLGGFGASKPPQAAAHASSSSLDDIFSGGLGHTRTSSHNSFVNHDADPFGSFGMPKAEPKVTQSQTLFDDDWNFGASKSKPAARGTTLHASIDGDLLGGFSGSSGRSKQATPFRSPQSSPRSKNSGPVFDEFLPGFGGGEQAKREAVPEADAMRGIPIINTDDGDLFGGIPSSASGAAPDPFGDIPSAKSSAEADGSRGAPGGAALDADEMRGIPPLGSSPILDDDPFSSAADVVDPFANIIAGSAPPPCTSSYSDPLDVFDLPAAASTPPGNADAGESSGHFSNGSGSYDPFDGFGHPAPVATGKAKEDGTPSRSGSGAEGREGSQGSGSWDDRPSRRVPFNVDLNEAPEVASPTYPTGLSFKDRSEKESNGFVAKSENEPKFDEPSVAGDGRRSRHDTDKVPVDIFEERWVTVEDVKQVTAPTTARPPSRAPPRPGYDRRRSSRGSASHRDSLGERSRGRSDEATAYRSSSSNGLDALKDAELARERAAAKEREASLVQKEREAAERERAVRQRERAERQRQRERERDRVMEQEAPRSSEPVRERSDSRSEASNARDDEGAERARRAAEKAAKEAQHRMEKAAADRAIAEARERAEQAALARQAAARKNAQQKEQQEKEQRDREEREKRDREERARRERAKEERERERERREKEDREKERERDRERDRRRERERGAAEQPRPASASSRATSEPRQRPPTSQPAAAAPSSSDVRRPSPGNPVYSSTGSSPAFSPAPRRPQPTVQAVDDWTTLLTQTAPTGDEFQDMPGETAERRKLRLERHQKTIERAQQALKEKNDRDKAQLMEQAERSRAAGDLDAEIRRWATGKEGNLRALLSSLHLILWPATNWKPLSLTDLITGISVKKAYQKAILCVHPDKVQQKGATVQQKYIAEKVFDLLKEAFAKFNSTELY